MSMVEDDFERRLRDGLRQHFTDELPASLTDRARRRVARRRTRQRATVAGTLVLALLGVGVVLPLVTRTESNPVEFADPQRPAPPDMRPAPLPRPQLPGGIGDPVTGAAEGIPAGRGGVDRPQGAAGPAVRPAQGQAVRSTGTQSISRNGSGMQLGADTTFASVSDDGTLVAFQTSADPFRSQRGLVGPHGLPDFVIAVKNVRTGALRLVSKRADGALPSGDSFTPLISGDGTTVAFVSHANNLTESDINNSPDVFTHNLLTGRTVRASQHLNGSISRGPVSLFGISGDGRWVLFRADRANYDNHNAPSGAMYLADTLLGGSTLISVLHTGKPVDSDSASISADGTLAVFRHGHLLYVRHVNDGWARVMPGLYDGPASGTHPTISANGKAIAYRMTGRSEGHVAVHDLTTGLTRIESAAVEALHDRWREPQRRSEGWPPLPAIGAAAPRLSADGLRLLFTYRHASGSQQVYWRDRVSGELVLVSGRAGTLGNGTSWADDLSADGRRALFTSFADNLIDGDGNNKADVFLTNKL